MKKMFVLGLLLAIGVLAFLPKTNFVSALTIPEINYVVYDEQDNKLFERVGVVVGDVYIDKYFSKYEVYLVDEINHIAKARFVEKLQKPNITKKSMTNIATNADKKIGLYLTHNDESYLIGDGYDSIYGQGGIHDVCNELAYRLTQKGIHVFLDETLHIPHDYYAYSRSKPTAQKLLSNNLNAIFDIHRDGASRSTYAKTTDGVEHSTVRIVVGQANPYKQQNLQFALYLMSVAETVCPWLFLDIFYASGHYNQDLFEKALLFEMGTYTIEKDLVMETVPYLAEVINTTLFNTTVDEEGDLTIGSPQSNENPTIDTVLGSYYSGGGGSIKFFTSSLAFIGLLSAIAFFVFQYRKRKILK